MSKHYLAHNSYNIRSVRANTHTVSLSMCAHNLPTHVFINDICVHWCNVTSKRISHYSVQCMRNYVRNNVNHDAINGCTEKELSNNYETVIHDS